MFTTSELTAYSLRGYRLLAEKYDAALAPEARELLRSLFEIPPGTVTKREQHYYLARQIAPPAGGGLHPRFAQALQRFLGSETVEFFTPRLSALGRTSGFIPANASSLQFAADQNDIVFFRSPTAAGVQAVERFFARSNILTEKSKGD